MLPLKVRKRMKWARESAKQRLKELVIIRKRKRLEMRLIRAAEIEKLKRIDNQTLQEIGDRFGLSRQRVEQILKSIAPKDYPPQKN